MAHNARETFIPQIWLELLQWFWIGRLLSIDSVFSLFHWYIPSEKRYGPSF